jgi:hypothetical protein
MADETQKQARDILARQDELEHERSSYEEVWEQVAEFCDPDAPDQFSNRGSKLRESQAERSERRGTRVYDNTINSAANRLAAGMESLIIPQSETWHGLSTAMVNDEETDEEIEWADGVRDFLFGIRYTPMSNFVPATQACIRNVVRYGPAYLYGEEGFGATLVHYASIPVVEAYIARNRWGVVDTFHRKYEKTARQCAQMFGYNKLPKAVKTLVDDEAKIDTKVTLVQCIKPREERRMYRNGVDFDYIEHPYASYHVIGDEEVVVKERGFRTFPVATFSWRRYEGDTYGISPTIEALTTVREINAIRRTVLRTVQQVTDPPLAYRAKADEVPPTLNPGDVHAGLVGDDGRLLVQPIITHANPSFAIDYAAQRSEDIRDMLFVNLFQILVQNPQMTATEALIRQEEKGALLGPAGSIIQAGFAVNLDRELSILEAKGLYDEGSRFLPPPSLAGKTIQATFTSPLDILRKAAESRDADMVVNAALTAAGAAQDPSILDNIDFDEYIRIKKDASRAPQKLLRQREEVLQSREARQQAQQAQMGMAAAGQGAQIAKDAVPAAVQAQQSGLMDQMQNAMQGAAR